MGLSFEQSERRHYKKTAFPLKGVISKQLPLKKVSINHSKSNNTSILTKDNIKFLKLLGFRLLLNTKKKV